MDKGWFRTSGHSFEWPTSSRAAGRHNKQGIHETISRCHTSTSACLRDFSAANYVVCFVSSCCPCVTFTNLQVTQILSRFAVRRLC
jgi:hypothetical protein